MECIIVGDMGGEQFTRASCCGGWVKLSGWGVGVGEAGGKHQGRCVRTGPWKVARFIGITVRGASGDIPVRVVVGNNLPRASCERVGRRFGRLGGGR